MRKTFLILATTLLLLGGGVANAADLLYQDTFDNTSRIAAGSLGQVATWTSVASPGEKAGNSLEVSWPDGGTQGWDHIVHDLGNTAIPTSGKVTVQWSFMQIGDPVSPAQQWVQGICRDNTSWYGACVRGENDEPNMLGLYVMDATVVYTGSGLEYSSNVWNTVGLVFDMDATEDNLDVYFSEGLDPLTLDDYWTTQTIDLAVWPIVTFQAIRYGYTDVGSWTNYIDDLSIYSGMPIEGNSIPGDTNRNGIVDDYDASVLAANWLSTEDVDWSDGDFNADGIVNDADATLLASNWTTGGAASAAVPEPCTLALLAGLMSAAAILLRCRRR